MVKTVIFSSYEEKGIVHDYVLSYLRYLKEVADNIIFIADNEAEQSEQEKLKDLCCHYEFVHHGEYDFGSYKRGFNWAKNNALLDGSDELILCNDSCFCVASLKNIFDIMDNKKCDFWGMVESKEIKPHLQSFFLDFRKSVFTSEYFTSFINGITKQKTVEDVVLTYEVPLKHFLEENGFKADAFCQGKKNNPMFYPLSLLYEGVPLLKKKVFLSLDYSKENPNEVLNFLKKNYVGGYNDICSYEKSFDEKLIHSCLYYRWYFLLNTCRSLLKKIRRFFFQKKISNSGRLCIKICHIPITNKFSRFIVDLIKIKGAQNVYF